MTRVFRWGALVAACASCASLAIGCDDGAPLVLEAGVVSDTSIEAGPYEVRVLAFDRAGISTATVAWFVDDHGSLGAKGSATLHALASEAGARGNDATRLQGFIGGQPLGSDVHWSVVVCDPGDRCTSNPDNGNTYEFHVGPEPSHPTLTSLAPDHGPASGGTRVELHGADFRPGAKVRFDGSEASHVEWLREDLVAAITAPHEPGVVDVVITNPDGRSPSTTLPFTYTPAPHVTSVSPASGPEAGGTPVVILGDTFAAGSRAFFGGVACRNTRVIDAGDIACDTPPGKSIVDVVVTAPDGGKGTLLHAFTYVAAPVVDGVDPSEGTSDGGDVVSIIGSGFSPDATASIGGTACVVTVVSLDGTEITCTTPPGTPGAADVVVTNGDGQSDTLPGAFGFIGPPVVVEVVPGVVPYAGNVPVRVLGAGFDDSDTVTFAGAPGTQAQVPADDEIDVTVPQAPVDLEPAPSTGFLAVDVVVARHQANDARTGTLAGGLVYFWPPEVDAVAPPSGPTAGGTSITITGRFFNVVDGQPIAVTIAGAACTDVQVVSPTSITCTTPAGPAGPADVVVINETDANGVVLSQGVGAGAFTYIAPPRVDSIDPPEGPTFGGDVVTVHGAFFQQGALVFIGGAPCTGVTFVDAGTLTCTTPPGAEGTADVVVTNPDGQSGTGPGLYRYLGVAVTPDHGLPVGFTRVSVRSAGMHADATITFDGVAAQCTFVSAREFSCNTPAHAKGDVDVTFLNGDGTTETGTLAFHYRTYVEHTSDLALPNGENVNDVDLADLDGDGDLDVVVSTGNVFFGNFGGIQTLPQSSFVYENDGHGHFTRHDIGVTSIANSGAVADINGDGRPDILFGCTNGTGPVLLANDGNFQFHQVNLGLDFHDDAFDAELVDVVGDGRKDLYNLSSGCDPNDPNEPNCDPNTIGPDVLLETTDNGFVDRSSLVPNDPRWTHDHKLVAADIDGDGDDDIVIISSPEFFPTEQNRVLVNRVNEGLGFVATFPPDLLNIIGDLYDIDAGDVDGDGLPDIALSSCTNDDSNFGEWLLRSNNGTLEDDSSALPSRTVSCTVGVAMVDLDDDGDLDLIYGGTNSFGDTRTLMRVFINKGDGTFVEASDALPQFAAGERHLQLNNFAAGDIDGDRDVDILVAGGAAYADAANVPPGAVVVLRLE